MKMMTTLVVATIALTTAPFAQGEEQGDESNFRMTLGVKTLNLSGTGFTHDTHPDDSFLPHSHCKGSAGKTDVDGQQYYASIGVQYSRPVPAICESLSWRSEIGILLGGQQDRHKNDNDTRPDANAAFVYTQSHFGFYGSVGLIYHVGDHFYVGGDTGYTGIHVDSGWDRFGQHESQKSSIYSFVTAGPTVGWSFSKDFSLEGTAQFGNTQMYGIQCVFKFW